MIVCKVYFYKDKDVNKELGNLIAGNTGFDGEVQNYIVVTSDMSALLEANGLAAGKDHQFKGRYDAEKNAVIISLEKDEREC